MSKIFDELQAQHIKLLDDYSPGQNPEGFLKEVQAYIEQVRIASQNVSDSRERSQLRANLRYWGGHVFESTGSYPNIELAPGPMQKQTNSFSISPRLLALVIIIGCVLGGFGLMRFLPSLSAISGQEATATSPTKTPTLDMIIEPALSVTSTLGSVEGLLVETSVKCGDGADSNTDAEIIVRPLNGTPPYTIPGTTFADNQVIIVKAQPGEILQLNLQSSDRPPLTWSGKVEVNCPIPVSSATAQAPLSEITDAKGIRMVLVPAGEFKMGSDNTEPDEQPVHTVFLNNYYIDSYEVTNALYRDCVNEGVCAPPLQTASSNYLDYFANQLFDNYPVIYVIWEMAKNYCEWRGARLPTEAEWEKAARGTDGFTYPWGNAQPNDELLNYNGSLGNTGPVDSYPGGKSPYGVYNMAGNVNEWTADWYQQNYYASEEAQDANPLGPPTGDQRVVRGGSWKSFSNDVRSTERISFLPFSASDSVGFRCAVSIS